MIGGQHSMSESSLAERIFDGMLQSYFALLFHLERLFSRGEAVQVAKVG